MARMKATMLFHVTSAAGSQQPTMTGGFSESVYFAGDTVNKELMETLILKRAALLPAGAQICGVRFQKVDPVGDSQIAATNRPGPNGALAQDLPQVGLLISCKGAAHPNVRKWWIRAVPDDIVQGGIMQATPAWRNALLAYGQELGLWYFRGQNLAAQQAAIASISGLGAFVLKDNTTFGVGDWVDVLRTVDDNGKSISGKFKVLTAGAGTGTLQAWPEDTPTVRGRMRKVEIVYPQFAYANMQFVRAGVKKVGRSFFQWRGRASKR